MRPFRIILIEDDSRRTSTFIVPFERAPEAGAIVKLPQGEQILVRHVLSAERDGLAGIVLAAPA
jgi:hypothetical protein